MDGLEPVENWPLGVMAQRFYEALPGWLAAQIPMTAKPEIVAGLIAALEAAREAK